MKEHAPRSRRSRFDRWLAPCAILSLALGVAFCATWLVASAEHRVQGWVRVTHEPLPGGSNVRLRLQGVTLRNGLVEAAWMNIDTSRAVADANPPSAGRSSWFFTPPGGMPLGVSSGPAGTDVRVPAWLVALLTAALPLAWYLRRRARLAREALARAGHCALCGYDLRASPDRCPECGHVVVQAF